MALDKRNRVLINHAEDALADRASNLIAKVAFGNAPSYRPTGLVLSNVLDHMA